MLVNLTGIFSSSPLDMMFDALFKDRGHGQSSILDPPLPQGCNRTINRNIFNGAITLHQKNKILL